LFMSKNHVPQHLFIQLLSGHLADKTTNLFIK